MHAKHKFTRVNIASLSEHYLQSLAKYFLLLKIMIFLLLITNKNWYHKLKLAPFMCCLPLRCAGLLLLTTFYHLQYLPMFVLTNPPSLKLTFIYTTSLGWLLTAFL